VEIEVGKNVLDANDRIARENRARFDTFGCFVINLMSAPGSGKTTILERTLHLLDGRIRCGVIEGDVRGCLDTDRLRRLGVPVVQINTDPQFGGECHLDARMVASALPSLTMDGLDLVFIENVGNLVCPAEFKVGEDRKVMVLSVTEGDDKPLKYPLMFRVSDLLLLNKSDLLGMTNFVRRRFRVNLERVNPKLPVIEMSATTGRGFEEWIGWLEAQVKVSRAHRASDARR
jgi:hydrogenase nickel incorporation protein HypB